MRITVLADDRKGSDQCLPEHGLSLLIEHEEASVLLDFGQTNRFMLNAINLGIDLFSVDIAVLSHGHYDHADGLAYIKNKKIFAHPDCFLKRYSKVNGKYDGMAISKDELGKNNELILSKESFEIQRGIFFLTGIPRNFEFENKDFPTILEDGTVDVLPDDSGIAVNTAKGVVVITGCAHSGICNTVEYAKSVCNNDRVYAVIGGFHLRQVDENFDKAAKYLKGLAVQHLLTGHCTCDDACEIMARQMQKDVNFQVLGAGKVFDI
ncbi:MAG: MBL fold metallo-hydrolase [Desulfofustis sp.]|nr:MBL fold metallo-hydrolase [Desulfofustis sp.]